MTLLDYKVEEIAFMFILFCNIGWIQESAIESFYHRRLINRGFLKGPYIPIYGFGGTFLLFCCTPFRNNGFVVYIVALLGCTVLEYFVGWFMETVFHKQFWDYSMMNFTYKNRISLVSSMFWGIMGLFMVYVLQDAVNWLIGVVPVTVMIVYTSVMAVAMITDCIITSAKQAQFFKKIKELPYDKAKKLVTEKFIMMGGAVMRRREKVYEFINKLRNKEIELFEEEESDIRSISKDNAKAESDYK